MYHDKLSGSAQEIHLEKLKEYAVELGLDREQFNSCLDSGDTADEVDADLRDGRRVGVQGTPTFFINGRFRVGAVPFESFVGLIDEELESKGISNPKDHAALAGR